MNIKLCGDSGMDVLLRRSVEEDSTKDTWKVPPEPGEETPKPSLSSYEQKTLSFGGNLPIGSRVHTAAKTGSSVGDEHPARISTALATVKAPPKSNRILSLGEALPVRFDEPDLRDWLSDFLQECLQEYRDKTCGDIKGHLDVLEASLAGLIGPYCSAAKKEDTGSLQKSQGTADDAVKSADTCKTSGYGRDVLLSNGSADVTPRSFVSGSAPQSMNGETHNVSPVQSFLNGNTAINVDGVYSTSTSKRRDPSNSLAEVATPPLVPTPQVSSHRFFITRTSSEDKRMDQIRATIASHRAPDYNSRRRCCAQIWEFLDNPFSGTLAWYYSNFVPMFVVASVTISVAQTIPGFPVDDVRDTMVQAGVETLFLTELILRFIVCPNRWAFWLSFFNYVDLVSTAPVGIRIYVLINDALGNDAKGARHLLTGMAVVPVLRLLKVTRRFEKFQLLLAAFQIAVEALPVLLYTMMLICLIFSALIYVVEREGGDNEAGQSLPQAMWFTVVTMTTVGYGDITPSTPHGHIVTCALMVISALYMAMPIGIVGNAFSQVWGDRDRLLLMQRLRDAFLQGGFTPNGIHAIMQIFDQDGSGELDVDEFQVMLKAMHINMGENRVYRLFNILDVNDQGVVNVEDFMKGIFPNCVAAMRRSARQSCVVRPGSMPG